MPAIVPALALARESAPELRAEIYGDGPERERVLALVRVARAGGRGRRCRASSTHGRVDAALRRALCLVLPSRREGYGLVVVEACAAGTPSVVVADPDNAATELIEEGVNGFVAPPRPRPRTSPRRSCACATRARRCARRPPPGTPRTRAACRSPTRSSAWRPPTRSRRDRGLRDRRHPERRPAARRLPARAADRARSARRRRGADRGRQRRRRGSRPTARGCCAQERNLGFAGGVARGLDAAAGEWVLLVNDDAELEPGAVRAAARGGPRGAAASAP